MLGDFFDCRCGIHLQGSVNKTVVLGMGVPKSKVKRSIDLDLVIFGLKSGGLAEGIV